MGATPSTVGGVSGWRVPLTIMMMLHTRKNPNTTHSTAPMICTAAPLFFSSVMCLPLPKLFLYGRSIYTHAQIVIRAGDGHRRGDPFPPKKQKNRLQKHVPCGYAVFAAGQSCSQSCLDTLALRLSLSADLPNIRYMGIIFFLSCFVKRHLVQILAVPLRRFLANTPIPAPQARPAPAGRPSPSPPDAPARRTARRAAGTPSCPTPAPAASPAPDWPPRP